MIFLEAVLMGIFATFVMDLAARFLVRRKLIHPFIAPEAVGRWFLYMFKGTFVHKDITLTQPLKHEKIWYAISHFLIGVVLAGLYLFLEREVPIIPHNGWLALIYGMATVLLPWFWLLPSTGFGFMASKSPIKSIIHRTNFINHTTFGLGLFLWIFVFHRFFI